MNGAAAGRVGFGNSGVLDAVGNVGNFATES
jgi:hypothetical protein